MAWRISSILGGIHRRKTTLLRMAQAAAIAFVGLVALAMLMAPHQPPTPLPKELDQRHQIRSEVVRLIAAGDFARLEQLASDYRSTRARTSSGVWKLTVFYGGVHDAAAIAPDDAAGWRTLAEALHRWRQAYPDSPTPYVAEAVVLKRYAWALRPHTLVVETAAGPEKRFVTALMSAQRFLRETHDRASSDPHYYVVRTAIETALDTDSADLLALVEEGAGREPAYYQLYFAALDHFAGHPDREAQDIEAFVNLAVERTRGIEGLSLYARLYWYASSAYYGADLISRTRIDWPKMRQGVEDVLARYPDAWNVNHFAHLACLAGDREMLAGLLHRVNGEPILQAWTSREVYDRCRALAGVAVESPPAG